MSHDPALILRLRSRVQDAIDNLLYTSAIFFANKLVSFSDGETEDVYLLAKSYYLNKEYNRTIHLLTTHNLIKTHLKSCLLAARCATELKEWQNCLDILGEEPKDRNDDDFSLLASMSYLRGNAYFALDNRKQAIHWFKLALLEDAYCYEAYEALVNNQLLPNAEEDTVFQELSFQEDHDWLIPLYATKLKRTGKRREWGFRKLEGTPLQRNHDFLASLAHLYFSEKAYRQCYNLTKMLLDEDPYEEGGVLEVHLCCLVELGLKNELFYCVHSLVDHSPRSPLTWYAVACYYLLTGNDECARRYFSKAFGLDPNYGPAWIGYGHSFSHQGEHDQAIAAYRSAYRLLPGSQLPALCISRELIRVNSLNLAEQYLSEAQSICPADPLILNEYGVLRFKASKFKEAASLFNKAIQQLTNSNSQEEVLEASFYNLGHCYRKLRQFEDAVSAYKEALRLKPISASTFASLGLTYHLLADLDKAIEFYHHSLSLKPDDSLIDELLNRALRENLSSGPLGSIFR